MAKKRLGAQLPPEYSAHAIQEILDKMYTVLSPTDFTNLPSAPDGLQPGQLWVEADPGPPVTYTLKVVQ